jgi:hypothetical protein
MTTGAVEVKIDGVVKKTFWIDEVWFLINEGSTDIDVISGSSSFSLSTASYDSVSFSVNSQDSQAKSIAFNNDWTKMYILWLSTDSVYQYTLSTGFNMSTASYDSVSFSVSSQDVLPLSLAFNTDWTKMYILWQGNDTVYQYTLSTGFNLSTASYDSISFSISSQDSTPTSLAFNNNGTKMYIVWDLNNSVFQYTTGEAFAGEAFTTII